MKNVLPLTVSRALILIGFVLIVMMAPVSPASAQDPALLAFLGGAQTSQTSPDPQEPPTSEGEVLELVAGLDDRQTRERLLAELNKQAAENADAADTQNGIAMLQTAGKAVLDHWRSTVAALPTAPATMLDVVRAVELEIDRFDTGPPSLTFLFVLLAGAALVAFGVRRTINRLWPNQGSMRQWLIRRLTTDAVTVAAFGVPLMLMMPQGSLMLQLAEILSVALAIILVSRTSAYAFQQPRRRDLRLSSLDDKWAWFMVRRTTWIGAISAATFLQYNIFTGMGRPEDAVLFVSASITIMFIIVIQTVWHGRQAFTQMLNPRGQAPPAPGEPMQLQHRIARWWHGPATLLLLIEWLVLEHYAATNRLGDLSIGGVTLTILIIVFLPSLVMAAGALMKKVYPVHDHPDEAEVEKCRVTQETLARIARAGSIVLLIYFVGALWGLNPLSLLAAQVGNTVAGGLTDAIVVLIMGIVVWELLGLWVTRQMAVEMADMPDQAEAGDMGGQGGTRLATVLPVIHRTGQIFVALITGIVILAELGVNITPILAGAGVIGIAIGFGAQTLVRDIVSGVFFLLDDAFRIGEYIDVGGTMGTVEKISIRSLRLRHHLGPLHTVPYGEIAKLTNYSRDWVIVKLKFRVPFDTDIKQVKKIFKEIGKQLLTHEEMGPDFIQPFKSQGVYDVDESGIVVRGKFMCKPGKQFLIRREVYVEVQKAFEAAGIEFARRQVIVQVAGNETEGGEPTSSVTRRAASAAAEAALEAEQEDRDRRSNAPDDFPDFAEAAG